MSLSGKETSCPRRVYANCDNFANDKDVEGHAQILAKFDNGMSASITFSAYSDVVYETYFYFTEGALKLTGTAGIQMKRKGEKEWQPVTYEKWSMHPFALEIDDFYRYVMGEESTIPDGEYSRAIIAAIEDVYK